MSKKQACGWRKYKKLEKEGSKSAYDQTEKISDAKLLLGFGDKDLFAVEATYHPSGRKQYMQYPE